VSRACAESDTGVVRKNSARAESQRNSDEQAPSRAWCRGFRDLRRILQPCPGPDLALLSRTILCPVGDLVRLVAGAVRSRAQLSGRKSVSEEAARDVHGTLGEATSRRRCDADHARRSVEADRLASSAHGRETPLASQRFSELLNDSELDSQGRSMDCSDQRADGKALDLNRQPNRHVAFGHGIHFCLGAPLARLEGQIAIRRLLERIADLRLGVPPETLRWRKGLVLRGVTKLPVTIRRMT